MSFLQKIKHEWLAEGKMHLKDRRANYDYAMFDKWMHDYF